MQEIQLYRDRKGSFGRPSALRAVTILEPDGGDMDIDANMPDVVMEEPSSTASDDGLPLGVFDVGVGSLDDDYAM
ncbi:hypothetical protein PIB30_007904 [Stylosanthes scabra]|uniref:Uncharacterized protein n=1 Tax=Stylosanthes scabra TaxID=79078 RepID=A0ABU6S481_9FABA|nr:hypothetical protein [Stylosanthes scabra]